MSTPTIRARDMMEPPRPVSEDMPVRELARTLVDQKLDGCCVVDAGGALVGVVTAMDLVFREKRIEGPTIFWFIDSPVVLGQGRFRHDLAKQVASTVRDVMTRTPTTVKEDTPIDEVATLMVERGFTILPVLDGARLSGVVTKWSILRAALHT
jgi:CBS domain-containing protein